MTAEKLTLEDVVQKREVILSDGAVDLKFAVPPLTRSRKHEANEKFLLFRDISRQEDDRGEDRIDPELEERGMRAACDVINVCLSPAKKPGDDEPTINGGDLLFDRWIGEQIEDGSILNLMFKILGIDPKNPEASNGSDPT